MICSNDAHMPDIVLAIQTSFTIGNAVLIGVVLYYFVQNYRAVSSKFNLGLLLFGGILLVHAIFSCPLYALLHLGCPSEVVALNTVSAILEFVALSVFLYVVRR